MKDFDSGKSTAIIVFTVVVVAGVAMVAVAGAVLQNQSYAAGTSWTVVKGPVVYEIDCPLLEGICPYNPAGGSIYSGLTLGSNLIRYEGTYYYSYTPPPPPYYPGRAFMVWFTNSTVVCISPSGGWGMNLPACPS